MLKKNRKIIFGLVSVVFVILTPVLVLTSLGYNFNSDGLQNSLQVKVETYPINARTYLNNRVVETNTPTDITITQSGESKVDITKEGYLDESFWVNSRIGQNLNTRLTQLKLLQEKGRTIFTQESDRKLTTIVDNNLIWLEGSNNFFIQKFNSNQLSGQPTTIQPVNDIPSIDNTNAKINWQIVGENTFYDKINQLIIHLSKDSWKIVSLNSRFQNQVLSVSQITKVPEQIVGINQDKILIRDKQNNLWELNLEDVKNPKISLLDQNITNLYYNVKSKDTWYITSDKLFKINGSRYNPQSNLLYLESSKLIQDFNQPLNNFVVNNFVQGVIIQINNNLYYYNDSSKNNLSLISDKTLNYTVFEDTLFWINITTPKGGQINAWNFNTNYQSILGYLQSSTDNPTPNSVSLDYSSKWLRLIIFEEGTLSSVWYDKSSVNHSISSYSLNRWISNHCSGKIINQNIFCLFPQALSKDRFELQVFENNNLF